MTAKIRWRLEVSDEAAHEIGWYGKLGEIRSCLLQQRQEKSGAKQTWVGLVCAESRNRHEHYLSGSMTTGRVSDGSVSSTGPDLPCSC